MGLKIVGNDEVAVEFELGTEESPQPGTKVYHDSSGMSRGK